MDAVQLLCTACAAAAVANSLWARVRLRLRARRPHRPRQDRQECPRVHVARARACVHSCLLLERARQAAACHMRRTACNMQHATCNTLHATRSRHDARCALRVPICDAAAYLEETQQIDVRGVRVRLRHARQQRLLGSVAIDRDLFELQAGTALQRWMRCSCCAQRVRRQLWPMHCGRVCD